MSAALGGLTLETALLGWAVVNGAACLLLLVLYAVGTLARGQQEQWDADLAMEEQLRLETRRGARLLRVDRMLGKDTRRPLEKGRK